MAGGADDLRLLPFDRRDRATDAERGRLDGIAGRERCPQLERLIQSSDLLLRPRRPLGRGTEPAIALPFGPRSRRRRRPSRLLIPASGDPDLLPQRLQLGACLGEFPFGRRGGQLALARRRRAHLLDLARERLLALAGGRREPGCLGARLLGRRALAAAARSAASASASSSAIRSRSGAIRSRASSTTSPSSPSRSAIHSACEVPGRPRARR